MNYKSRTRNQRHRFDTINGLRILLASVMFAVLSTGCSDKLSFRDGLQRAGGGQPLYTLAPGDRIRVTVYEYEDLSGDFTVDDTGRISLPLIRGIMVQSLALPQLEDQISSLLEEKFIKNPKVSVELLALRNLCVLGEVRNPGCYSYAYGMTAGKLIALAGGYTYRARQNELVITRNKKKLSADHDSMVLPEDFVEVFERHF